MTLLAVALTGCSSKEERQAKAAIKQMMQGCLDSRVPKEVCQCAYDDDSLVKSAIRVSEDRNNEEARVTFASKLHTRVAACVQSELGISPDLSQSDEQRRMIEQLIPRR